MSNETITIPIQEYLDLQTQWKPEHTIFLIIAIALSIMAMSLIIYLLTRKEN